MIAPNLTKSSEQTPEARFVIPRLRDGVRVPRLRPMGVFAEQEIVIPTGPFAGRKYRAARQPYSGLLFAALGKWGRNVITGPTQSGKTLQAFVIPTLYHLFEMGETVICGLPTLDMAGDKWERDLKPVIEAGRYRDLLPLRGAGSRGGTPDIITFRNGAQLKFMGGGGGDKQRAHFTSRVVIITETDGLDEAGESSREADKISQLEGRSRAFGDRAVTYMECTVSTTEGRTWREYTAGTASRIVAPCPHCRKWVAPERDHLRGWQDAPTELDAEERAHFACPECGGVISVEQRVAMNGAAKLVHRGQEIDEAGTVLGPPPRTKTLGFRWSAFQNLFATPGQLGAEEWRAAHTEDREMAERQRKQFAWCIPVVEDRVENSEITAAIVRGATAEYGGRCSGVERGVVPSGTRALTAFVDVHSRADRLLYYVICAWLDGGRCVVIDYGRSGDPGLRDVIGAEKSIEANLRDLRDDWTANPYCSGTAAVKFNQILVDAGWMPHVVLGFISETRRKDPAAPWSASMGDPHYTQPSKKNKDKKPSPNGDPWYLSRQRNGMWQVNMHVDYWKSVVHEAFMVKPIGDDAVQRPGSIRLFGDDHREHFQFADQVTAEALQRTFDQRQGWMSKWIKRGKDNHYLDCMYGNFVAASMCGVLSEGLTTPEPASSPKPQQSAGKGFIRKPSGGFLRRGRNA